MIEAYITKLYDQVFEDLYSSDTFEDSFDANTRIWLEFRIHVDSLMSGVDIRTIMYLSKFINKADYEIGQILMTKAYTLNNPEAKLIWESLFGKRK